METGEIQVYSTASLDLLKTITYLGGFCILDAEFNQDSSRLFCSVRGRGILVIDTIINDQLEHWKTPFDHPVDFGIEDRLIIRLTLNPDGQKIYVALREGEARGAVAAINTIQKKLVRILDLSPTACTSVVVIGEKLFAACLRWGVCYRHPCLAEAAVSLMPKVWRHPKSHPKMFCVRVNYSQPQVQEVVSKTYALPFALGDGVHLPLAGALLLPRGAL